MKNLYPNLHQFFAGYFHQDWLEDAANALHVVAGFLREATPEEIRDTSKEFRDLLSQTTGEDDLPSIVVRLGSYYNPRADGLSYRDWLLSVCVLLEQGDAYR